MAIEDYIPNIFGSTPQVYQGLLTPQQSQALEKRANLAGLLGFAGALAQGMSPQGYQRSALQNILTAAGAGFGGAGQTYEAGISQLANLQKLQQSQAQIEAINQLAKDPTVAGDPAMMAYLRANPAEAIKYLAETRQFQKAREAAMPTTPIPAPVAPVAAPAPTVIPEPTFRGITTGKQVGDIGFTLDKEGQLESMVGGLTSGLAPRIGVTGAGGVGLTGRGEMLPTVSAPEPVPTAAAPTTLAPVTVTGNPEIARLEALIQRGLVDASVYSDLRRPQDAEATLRSVERLRERQQQLMAADIDLDQRINAAPNAMFKEQYATLNSLRDSLKPKEFMDALQKIDTAVMESGKQFKFEGAAGNFAYRMFGTNDMTKMTQPQMDLVLRYQNAPTQADQTKIVIDAQRLLEETGARVPVPTSRESMIGNVPPVAPPPVITPTAPAVTAPTAVVSDQGIPQEFIAASKQPKPVTTPTEAKQVVKEVNKPVVDINVTPLIKQPDTQVPPKTKKELLVKQPSTVALSSYALKNVVDARDSAQKLLENPAYIDALTGVTAPAMKNIPGTDAFTANQLMQNLLGRAFVNELSQMRNASPTGGAVGNVAVAEMESLSKIQSALTVGMKKGEFEKQLKQYINVSNRAIKTIPNEYARTYGYNGEFDDLLKGTVVEQQAPALPQGVKVKRVR